MEPKQSYKTNKKLSFPVRILLNFLCICVYLCVYWIRAFLDAGFCTGNLNAALGAVLKNPPISAKNQNTKVPVLCCLSVSTAVCCFQCCQWRLEEAPDKSINSIIKYFPVAKQRLIDFTCRAPVAFALVMSIFKDILEVNSCEFGNTVKVNSEENCCKN